MKRKKSNQSGQAFIQVMIGLGIVVIFASSILTTTTAVHQNLDKLFYKNNLEGLSHVFSGILNNPYLCSSMFKFNTGGPDYAITPAPSASPTPPASVQDLRVDDTTQQILTSPAAIISSTSPQNIPSISTKILAVQFVMPSPPVPAPSPPPGQIIYSGDLVVITQSTLTSTTAIANRRIIGQMTIVTDSTTGSLVDCSANFTTSSVCASMGGRVDPTLTPSCRLGIEDVTCPAGQIITAINNTTLPPTPTCASPDFKCPCMTAFPGCVTDTQRQVLIGFADGVPQCVDATDVNGCTIPAGTTWWNPLHTLQCGTNVTTVIPGDNSIQNIPSTSPAPTVNTGVGQFQCNNFTLSPALPGYLASSTCN